MNVEVSKRVNITEYKKITDKKINMIVDDYLIVEDDKLKIVSLDGKIYEEYEFINYQFSRFLVKTSEEKYVLLSNKLDVIFEICADGINFVDDNVMVINKNGKEALIDFSGAFITPFYNWLIIYNDIKRCVAINDHYAELIDYSGNVIAPTNNMHLRFSQIGYGKVLFLDDKNTYAYDMDGNLLNVFKRNLNVCIVSENLYKIVKVGTKIVGNILDDEQNKVFSCKNNDFGFTFESCIYVNNGKAIIFKHNFSLPSYTIFKINNSKKLVKNNKKSFIVNDKRDNLYIVYSKKRYGLYDNLGNEIIPFSYDKIMFTKFKDIFIVKSDEEYKIINSKNEVLSNTFYNEVIDVSNGDFLGLRKDNDCIIVNNKIEYLFSINNHYIVEIIHKCGLFVVVDSNLNQALYKKDGDIVIPFSESEINIIDNNRIIIDNCLIELNQEYFNINLSNRVILTIDEKSYENYLNDKQLQEYIEYLKNIEEEHKMYVENMNKCLIDELENKPKKLKKKI